MGGSLLYLPHHSPPPPVKGEMAQAAVEVKRTEWLSEPEGRSSGLSRVQDHGTLLLLAGGCGERRHPSGVREETILRFRVVQIQSGSKVQILPFAVLAGLFLDLSWGQWEYSGGTGGDPGAVPEGGTTLQSSPSSPSPDRQRVES